MKREVAVGSFVVMQVYRIRDQYRPQYLELLPTIVRSGMDLGCTFFDAYEDDDVPNMFIEMMGFDSWTHYERLRTIPPTRVMEQVSRSLEEWIEGGLDGVKILHLQTRAVG